MTAAAEEVVHHVLATVDYLRASSGPLGDGWIPCLRVTSDPGLLLELARSTGPERGIDRDDVAVSLFTQGYAFRVASIAIGGWILDRTILDVSPPNMAVGVGRSGPDAVRFLRCEVVQGEATSGTLRERLVEAHLAPLVDTAHRAAQVGERLLWGNVASAVASSFGAFMAPLPDLWAEIRDSIGEFFAGARFEMARAGRVVPVGSVWAWERQACCLWYQTEAGSKCQDCSLWTDRERRERYDRVLAGLRG